MPHNEKCSRIHCCSWRIAQLSIATTTNAAVATLILDTIALVPIVLEQTQSISTTYTHKITNTPTPADHKAMRPC